MVIKIGDIFKGNIKIYHYINIVSDSVVLVTIDEELHRLRDKNKTIKLSWILNGLVYIKYDTIIAVADKPYKVYSTISYDKGKFILRYKCSNCDHYITYSKYNPILLCNYCKSRGIVKW